jgi:hypothetical protein
MKKQPLKPRTKRPARPPFKPQGFSFKREAKWITAMNLAPFGIGVVLALVFWFTR